MHFTFIVKCFSYSSNSISSINYVICQRNALRRAARKYLIKPNIYSHFYHSLIEPKPLERHSNGRQQSAICRETFLARFA